MIGNVYYFTDSLNFMLEFTGSTSEEVTGEQQTAWTQENIISPGVRYAIDHEGWQFVPGLAFPIGLGATAGQNQVLLYFSVEGKVF